MNTKSIGELSEAILLGRLLKRFVSVSIPFGNNQRYDLIVDDGKHLLKVQCKTGILKNRVVSFRVCNHAGGHDRKDYKGQIDYFAVYCPQIEKSYLVSVDAVGRNSASLRTGTTKNGQHKGIRSAKDFEL